MSSFDRLNGYLNAKVETEECRIPGDHWDIQHTFV